MSIIYLKTTRAFKQLRFDCFSLPRKLNSIIKTRRNLGGFIKHRLLSLTVWLKAADIPRSCTRGHLYQPSNISTAAPYNAGASSNTAKTAVIAVSRALLRDPQSG